MNRDALIERLRWLATSPQGTPPPDWLADNDWQRGIAEVASAALAIINPTAMENTSHEFPRSAGLDPSGIPSDCSDVERNGDRFTLKAHVDEYPPEIEKVILHAMARRSAAEAKGPRDWAQYRQMIDSEDMPGWTVCRMGARIGNPTDPVEFYYGNVRDGIGIYTRAFDVCDLNHEAQVSCLLTTLMHIKTGTALGLFNSKATAIMAADMVLNPRDLGHANRWGALPTHDLDDNDKQQALAWRAHMNWAMAMWRFAGIAPADDCHAHVGGSAIQIWRHDEVNITMGKTGAVS